MLKQVLKSMLVVVSLSIAMLFARGVSSATIQSEKRLESRVPQVQAQVQAQIVAALQAAVELEESLGDTNHGDPLQSYSGFRDHAQETSDQVLDTRDDDD